MWNKQEGVEHMNCVSCIENLAAEPVAGCVIIVCWGSAAAVLYGCWEILWNGV